MRQCFAVGSNPIKNFKLVVTNLKIFNIKLKCFKIPAFILSNIFIHIEINKNLYTQIQGVINLNCYN